MISCPLPWLLSSNNAFAPETVSISEHLCEHVNSSSITITNRTEEQKGGIGICTKVIYGSPDPIRLVEWIELNKMLGADSIYMYNTSVYGPVNKVLEYYAKKGYITLYQHPFPNTMTKATSNQTFPTSNYYQNWEYEILSINDCLYTAKEEFLAVFDIDEILYPAWHGSLSQFVTSDFVVNSPSTVSYLFHTGVYSDEIVPDTNNSTPWYLHTILRNRRTRIDWESPKSITRRRNCMYHGHHMCFRVAGDFRVRHDVPHKYGHLRHYREKCRLTGEPNKCQKLLRNPELDRSLDKFGSSLGKRVFDVLRHLGLNRTHQ